MDDPLKRVTDKFVSICKLKGFAIFVFYAGLILWGIAGAQTMTNDAPVWSGVFSNDWMFLWPMRDGINFGAANLSVLYGNPATEPSPYLRVQFPKGSWSPAATQAAGLPVGGTQFYSPVCRAGVDAATLSYYLRFCTGFPFVKGGKLPGLYGGIGNTGTNTPNGTDGFSARFMWQEDGGLIAYPFLPTSPGDGTSIGKGVFSFTPGKWYLLTEKIVLNEPGVSDGEIEVSIDGKLVFAQGRIEYRTASTLQINGILFQTFFGGDDPSWAATEDCHIDFANFTVTSP
jgi:hypothetical protein